MSDSGEYDYGHRDAARLKPYKIKAYDFTSKSDMPVRQTGNYADNAMADPSQKNEGIGDSTIDRLQEILHRAGLTDAQIEAGASLTEKGFQKVAAQLDISAEDVKTFLLSLKKRLSQGTEPIIFAEGETSPRYSYEPDSMMNVTVRDSETGKEYYYGGSKGAALVKMLKGIEHGDPEEQSLLATYVDRESLSESEEDDDYDFKSEIASDVTTFNFPWKNGDKIGTATAQCKGDGDDLHIEVIDARDSNGDEISITDALEDILKDQAVEFIPEA